MLFSTFSWALMITILPLDLTVSVHNNYFVKVSVTSLLKGYIHNVCINDIDIAGA